MSNFVYCNISQEKKGDGGDFALVTNILHRSDGTIVSVSRSIEPAVLAQMDAQNEIERLSRVFHEGARTVWLPTRAGLPKAVIALWGQLQLEPLQTKDVSNLVSEKREIGGFLPGEGFLVDFLDDYQRSAKLGLGVYRLRGREGYIWAASFDENGRGHLRFAAVNASIISNGVGKPALGVTTAQANSQAAVTLRDTSRTTVATGRTVTSPDTVPATSENTSKPPSGAVGSAISPNPVQNVANDNEDRKRRLQRIGESNKEAPTIYDYLVTAGQLAGQNGDVHVLRVVFKERVFFDTDSSDIRPEAMPVLEAVAEAMRKEPDGSSLFVAGHTDSSGPVEHNQTLSVDRAKSVARRLFELKVGAASVWNIGFGAAIPLRPNDSPENKAMNRRVEFIIATNRDAIEYWLGEQGNFLCSDATAPKPEDATAPKPEFCRPPPIPSVNSVPSSQQFPAEQVSNDSNKNIRLITVIPHVDSIEPPAVPIYTPGRPLQ